jgi:hypothetical protein
MIVGTETHLASKPIPPIVSSKQEMDPTRLTPFAPLNVIQLEMMESTLVILNISAVSMHSQASIAVRTVIAPVTCQDYKCTTCDINDDGTGCCLDSDCPNGQKCEENACITKAPEIPGCSTDNIGTECCNNDDCPTAEYTCELDACVTAPFFLVSDYDPSKDWCVSANKGVGGWAEVGFEPCITSNTPAIQLWRHDTQGRIRSNSDLSRCMVTGPEGGTLSGFKMVMASCRLNEFRFGSETVDKIRLAQDETYCLTSYDETVDGRVSGNICEDTGKFDFELDFV